MSKSIILIKLGGSIITDKNSEKKADLTKIQQLAQEIHGAKRKTADLIVLGHGAGSFGHPQAKKYGTKEGLTELESIIGMAQVRSAVTELNALVINALIAAQEPAITISPFSFITSSNKVFNSLFLDSLLNVLDHKGLPVIHGDVITDNKIGCTIFSGETILNILAEQLQKQGYVIKCIIEVGKTDGVYDENGETIPEINSTNFSQMKHVLQQSEGIDVTGGMLHKVEEAYTLAQKGIPTLLISANTGNLQKAIVRDKVSGTWIKK